MREPWAKATLGEICHVYQPKTISKKEMKVDGKYPVYGANGIIGRYDQFNHEHEELILGCRGSCGSVNVSLPKSWITGNAMVIKPMVDDLDRRFLEYWLRGIANLSEAISGTAQPQITRQSLTPLEILLPPLSEQQRIVAILDEALEGVNTAIANAEKNLANARELFESYLNEVFEKKGVGWVTEALSKSVKFIDYRGKTPPKVNDGIRLITAKNVRMGFVQTEPEEFIDPSVYNSWMTRGFPKKGDVLFTTEAPLGNVAQLDTDETVVIGQRLITMQPDENVLDPAFLKYALMSRPIQEEIYSRQTGATVFGIKARLLKQVPIFFPRDVAEQRKIAGRIDEFSGAVQRLQAIYQQKVATFAELKQSFLQKAFSGELTGHHEKVLTEAAE